jgi:AcrR family transcriptional regulator
LEYRRRFGPETSATRTRLLDVTEQLMLDEGYAAVSTRRVAKNAGLTPGLVHYYFRTTDDLLIALYRRSTERNYERLVAALASEDPVQALWELSSEPMRTTLTLEFLALANHRKAIRAEIVRYAELARTLQVEAMARILKTAPQAAVSPFGVTALIVVIARGLTMEENVGITTGHEEARELVEWLLSLIARSPPPTAAAPRSG